MVDLVFMMNIYFLVTSLTAIAPEIDLPLASHVVAIDESKSVPIVIVVAPDGKSSIVTAGDEKGKLTDPDEQVESIQKAVEKGVRDSRADIVIRAEKAVKLRDISRLAGAAGKVEGSKLYVGVLENVKK